MNLVAGVDEAGRGALAGPVVAAAVILDPARPIQGLADSKQLKPARREVLAARIRARALEWAVACATAREVERLNVLRASLLAMRRAVLALELRPGEAQVDGLHVPEFPGLDCRAAAIVGGDRLVPAIGAASILAKVDRDGRMRRLHECYPAYGFARHKGYPTAAHLAALQQHGPSPEHRRSYAPVRRVLEER